MDVLSAFSNSMQDAVDLEVEEDEVAEEIVKKLETEQETKAKAGGAVLKAALSMNLKDEEIKGGVIVDINRVSVI